MKKLLFIAAVALLFASCSKEGAPQHSHQISTIHAGYSVFYDDELQYSYDSRLVEEWHWEGNELYRIDYYEDQDTYSENFYYNGRHQIVQSTVPAYSLRTEISYDGRKMQRICIYYRDELATTMNLTHDGRHVTQIEVIESYAIEPTAALGHTLQLLMGETLGGPTCEALSRCCRQTEAKGSNTFTLALLWEDDDLAQIVESTGTIPITIDYQYDVKHNPFLQLYNLYEMDNSISDFGFHIMSAHNVIEKSVEPSAYGPAYYLYEYDSDGYPTVINLQQSQSIVSPLTGDPLVITHKERRTIEYR